MSHSPRHYVQSNPVDMDYLRDQYYRGALWFVVIITIIVILIDLYILHRSSSGGVVSNMNPSWLTSFQTLFIIFIFAYIILGFGVLAGLKSDISWNDKIAIGILYLVVLAMTIVWFYYLLMVGDANAALAVITATLLLTIFLFWYCSQASSHATWAIVIFLIWLAILSLANLKWGSELQVKQE